MGPAEAGLAGLDDDWPDETQAVGSVWGLSSRINDAKGLLESFQVVVTEASVVICLLIS